MANGEGSSFCYCSSCRASLELAFANKKRTHHKVRTFKLPSLSLEQVSCVNFSEYDLNLDELLDREEFAGFIKKLTADTVTAVSRNLIIALLVAPTVALLTKRATERVPGVGKVVHKVPNSVYASLVTLGVVLIQKSSEGYE